MTMPNPMKRVTGGSLPVRIWRDFMVAGDSGQPPRALLAGTPAGLADEAPSHRSLWDKIISEFGELRGTAAGGIQSLCNPKF